MNQENTSGKTLPVEWFAKLDLYVAELQFWWTDLEFGAKIFFVLLACLIINLVLIKIAWAIYGEKLTGMCFKGVLFLCYFFTKLTSGCWCTAIFAVAGRTCSIIAHRTH